jgi:hypothetical protein
VVAILMVAGRLARGAKDIVGVCHVRQEACLLFVSP